jgi:argininosuccinate synthase
MAKLNALGGANGVGRVDMVENRFVGMKSRGVYETPGGTILYKAHRAVESITMDREVMLARDQMSPKIAQLIYNGFWYSPEMDLMMDFVRKTQENVTGTARVRLYKGNCDVVGRKAPRSLYDEKISTFEEDAGAYEQADAGAFIKLNALRLRVRKNAGLF